MKAIHSESGGDTSGLTVHNDDQGVWRRFVDAPHRGFFAAGAVAIVLLGLWWAVALTSHARQAYPATMVHALLMPLGVFPMFMLGFLFTAGPRWLNINGPTGTLPLALGFLSGLLAAVGGFAYTPVAAVAGLLVMLLVWSVGTTLWLGCLLKSRVPDRRHGWRVLFAMTIGALAMLLAVLWARNGDVRLWNASWQLALWGFLLPVFLTVSHRMVPFFTQSALPGFPIWRPYPLLDTWLSASLALALAAVAGLAVPQAIVAIAFALSLAYTSVRWGLRASLANRLLAMLHLSFAWLAPAVLLQGLGALGVHVGAAPAHALGLGFCVTMLVGFVTRVTLGHSGRPLVADRGYWAIYLALHAVAVMRVLAALLTLPTPWLSAISGVWLVLMATWAARVMPIYWQRRVDGKPG